MAPRAQPYQASGDDGEPCRRGAAGATWMDSELHPQHSGAATWGVSAQSGIQETESVREICSYQAGAQSCVVAGLRGIDFRAFRHLEEHGIRRLGSKEDVAVGRFPAFFA